MQQAPAIECVLVRTLVGQQWTYSGELRARSGLSGSYRLSVSSGGPGSRSAVNQSGTFEAPPGRVVRIGMARVSASGAATPDAQLEIRTPEGSVICPVVEKGLEP